MYKVSKQIQKGKKNLYIYMKSINSKLDSMNICLISTINTYRLGLHPWNLVRAKLPNFGSEIKIQTDNIWQVYRLSMWGNTIKYNCKIIIKLITCIACYIYRERV